MSVAHLDSKRPQTSNLLGMRQVLPATRFLYRFVGARYISSCARQREIALLSSVSAKRHSVSPQARADQANMQPVSLFSIGISFWDSSQHEDVLERGARSALKSSEAFWP